MIWCDPHYILKGSLWLLYGEWAVGCGLSRETWSHCSDTGERCQRMLVCVARWNILYLFVKIIFSLFLA
jgi:hypothetical protein